MDIPCLSPRYSCKAIVKKGFFYVRWWSYGKIFYSTKEEKVQTVLYENYRCLFHFLTSGGWKEPNFEAIHHVLSLRGQRGKEKKERGGRWNVRGFSVLQSVLPTMHFQVLHCVRHYWISNLSIQKQSRKTTIFNPCSSNNSRKIVNSSLGAWWITYCS